MRAAPDHSDREMTERFLAGLAVGCWWPLYLIGLVAVLGVKMAIRWFSRN